MKILEPKGKHKAEKESKSSQPLPRSNYTQAMARSILKSPRNSLFFSTFSKKETPEANLLEH